MIWCCRYDFDNSGTLNSQEELAQLTFNLLFKLANSAGIPMNDTTMDADAVEAVCKEMDPPLSEENELALEDYTVWLKEKFGRTGLL